MCLSVQVSTQPYLSQIPAICRLSVVIYSSSVRYSRLPRTYAQVRQIVCLFVNETLYINFLLFDYSSFDYIFILLTIVLCV